ncbi:MAG: valine--tRNA ligase [Saprospiraceae bacterium]
MTLSTRYNPKETEEKWYQHWMDHNYFHSEPDEREAYSIVIPPPNVTGVLHMGHMLNNTIQDILIRKARLEGKNACWVPGTDHASIATEAKVVKMLAERGIKKSDISREEFLDYAFEWKEKYGGIILDQLKKLGASCDWERTRFTMEPKLSAAVIKVFVDLHRKGKLYRGLRMTNWDPEALTVLSNEEVIYVEEHSQLFHIRYDVEGEPGRAVVIATQRPETIMADTAVAVHPDDERFKDLIGKKVIIPLINRAIPVIADTYVDMAFGTGALKITPAHDQNDNAIGEKYKLEVIDILNANGTLNEKAQILVGEDRFVARKKIKKMLEESGHLEKLEDYVTSIGRSERTNAVVEPRLTLQWFLNMKEMARMARHSVEGGDIKFNPPHFWNMFNSWLREENIRDWCISRQLLWGQRIPAWYYKDETFVAETAAEALELAKKKTGENSLTIADLHQDEDVVDTWFSSWLWPISVFDGFERQDELRYYYPTNVLVTAWDIIFFWVARMIMSGYEWSGDLLGLDHVLKHGRMPFKDVYFTGMVRDNKRRKMSKSLGNSPDALALIDTYGADGIRFGVLSSSAAGNDIIFDAPIDPVTKQVLNESKLCEQGRNFCNKLWNALRLIKGWERSDKSTAENDAINALAFQWLENRLHQTLDKTNRLFDEFRLSEAVMDLYKFIWGDFCSWYLEMIKPAYGEPIDQDTYDRTLAIFGQMMTILHPFMPFITEEVWHNLQERAAGDDCVISQWPLVKPYDEDLLEKVEMAKTIVSSIRDIRNSKGLKPKELLKVFKQGDMENENWLNINGLKPMIEKMASLESLTYTTDAIENSVSFLVGRDKFFIPLIEEIDAAAEQERLKKDLEYYQGFVKNVEKKLSNERFVNNAPANVVELERRKLADGLAKLENLQEAIGKLN